MGTKTTENIPIEEYTTASRNKSRNSSRSNSDMTTMAPHEHCTRRRWSKLDCSSPVAPTSTNASNSGLASAIKVLDGSLSAPPLTSASQVSLDQAELPMFNSPIHQQQSDNSKQQSGPGGRNNMFPSKLGAKQTSLTFAEVVLDEAIPSPPAMPQRRETLQMSPRSARKTTENLLSDYSDDDSHDGSAHHTCGPVSGKKKEVKGILKKKESTGCNGYVAAKESTPRWSDAPLPFDGDAAPAPPTMPQRQETLQLSPKTSRKTSLTFACPNYDEPVPAPPTMPQRRDTLQLSPKSARQACLTVLDDIDIKCCLDDDDDDDVNTNVVKGILKKKDVKKVATCTGNAAVRTISSHDQCEAVPVPPLQKKTSLTFANEVYDEPVPAPPAMPVRRETLQLSPESARKTSLTLEDNTGDLEWDDEDDDVFNKMGSVNNKKEVKGILRKKKAKKESSKPATKIATVRVRKQRSVSPGRNNRRPLVRPVSPTRNRQ